jgi:fatty acid desaturase
MSSARGSLGAQRVAADHAGRTARMLAETAAVSFALWAAALYCWSLGFTWAVWLLAVPRGLWLQRHYCVGHEASHLKLFPKQRWLNAVFGQLYLLPLLTPLAVFRKIHLFHHGNNRRDAHTSALDVIWLPRDTWYFRGYGWARWLFATYFGGWFWHGLISILMFLLLPVAVARRVSPAFEGWTTARRVESLAVFGVAVAILLLPWALGGFSLWLACSGGPLLVFSWFYSAHLYVYHYRTALGPTVRHHARHLGGPFASWWLLNLNHHDAHHAQPSVVWYAIPELRRGDQTAEFGSGRSLWWGMFHQLRGPLLFIQDRVKGAP